MLLDSSETSYCFLIELEAGELKAKGQHVKTPFALA